MKAMRRGHHEALAQTLSTLVYLAPALAVVGRKVGQAIRATVDRWKGGQL